VIASRRALRRLLQGVITHAFGGRRFIFDSRPTTGTPALALNLFTGMRIPMTTIICPDRGTTELAGTNYIRSYDDATMVEGEPGWFFSDSKTRKQVSEKDVKPRVRTKPRRRCNLEKSTTPPDIISCTAYRLKVLAIAKGQCGVGLTTEFKEQARRGDTWVPSCRATVHQRNVSLPSFFVCITPPGLCDTTKEASRNRTKLECYRVDYPEKDYPEHTLWPRAPRNRGKAQKHLQPFWEHRNLNQSTEPIQSNWLKSDNDNFEEREEGDAPKPKRSFDAELEMRPSVNELASRWSGVKYETWRVRTSDIRLSEDGYLCNPIDAYREMKIPVSGDVEVFGFHRSLGIKATQKQIDEFKRQHKNGTKQHNAHVWAWVDHAWKPRILNIADVDKSRKWTLYRIGDLFFAPDRTKEDRKGAVTHYIGSNGKKIRAKDKYGSPYGPESTGSDEKYWKRSAVAVNDNSEADQPGEVKSSEDFHVAAFGYAFGATSTACSTASFFDDVVERKQHLVAVNARLSPEALRVCNMVVSSDETEALAGSKANLGAALHIGRRALSESQARRRGDDAMNDTADKLAAVYQALAA
jgi:hypothetical protein